LLSPPGCRKARQWRAFAIPTSSCASSDRRLRGALAFAVGQRGPADFDTPAVALLDQLQAIRVGGQGVGLVADLHFASQRFVELGHRYLLLRIQARWRAMLAAGCLRGVKAVNEALSPRRASQAASVSAATGRSVATPWPLSARYCSHLPRKVFIRMRWPTTSAGGGYMPITSCQRRPT